MNKATEARLDTVICVYGDAVEQAIRDTYYAVNGEDFPEDESDFTDFDSDDSDE